MLVSGMIEEITTRSGFFGTVASAPVSSTKVTVSPLFPQPGAAKKSAPISRNERKFVRFIAILL